MGGFAEIKLRDQKRIQSTGIIIIVIMVFWQTNWMAWQRPLFNNNDNDFPDKLASTNCAGSQNKICRNDDDNDDIIIAVFT